MCFSWRAATTPACGTARTTKLRAVRGSCRPRAGPPRPREPPREVCIYTGIVSIGSRKNKPRQHVVSKLRAAELNNAVLFCGERRMVAAAHSGVFSAAADDDLCWRKDMASGERRRGTAFDANSRAAISFIRRKRQHATEHFAVRIVVQPANVHVIPGVGKIAHSIVQFLYLEELSFVDNNYADMISDSAGAVKRSVECVKD